MSVIQTLRGRGSVVVTIMLILALVAFIFMDSFQNVGEIFREDRTLIAEVNGERIETQKYSQALTEYEEAVKKNQGKDNYTDEELEGIRSQFWNQKLNEVLIGQENDLLGITVTEKERNSMFTSLNADPMVKQNFTDPETGIFDPNRVIQYEQQIIQGEDINMKKQWGKFKEELLKQRRVNKYVNMIKMGIYAPKFMMDEMAKQQFVTANISYVKVPYETVDATNIKISDAEITDYMKSHKALYTLEEDQVGMEYVSFPVIPTAKDSSASLGFLNEVKEAFTASTNPYDFASDKTDELSDESFYNANTLTGNNNDALLAASVGSIVGPYYDNGMYRLSKVTERKSLPDSVRASHILIQPSETLTDAQAKAAIDSLEKQVKAGANFAALATARSADQGSAQKGGDVGYFAKGMMVPEFEEFCFEGEKSLGVVKSQFGYHLIKLADKKAFQPNIKVASIAKLLEASQETITAAQQKATDFTSKAKDQKSYNDAAKKMGMDKRIVQNVTKTQGVVQGLGNVRNLVRWAYANEVGAISPAMMFEDKLVVARLTSKSLKGDLADVNAKRGEIESVIRRRKQVEQVAAKVKGSSNLQAIATAFSTEVLAADSLKMLGLSHPELGYEPKVLAAAVNPANVNKVSAPIPGQSGVYFISVKAIADGLKNAPRVPQMERMQIEGQYMNSVEQFIPVSLRKRANINDNRSVSLSY